jgi:hypothetical protein
LVNLPSDFAGSFEHGIISFQLQMAGIIEAD